MVSLPQQDSGGASIVPIAGINFSINGIAHDPLLHLLMRLKKTKTLLSNLHSLPSP